MYPTSALIAALVAERRRQAQSELRARAAAGSTTPARAVAQFGRLRAALVVLGIAR